MRRRWLSVVACLCLLFGYGALPMAAPAGAESGYVLAELDYRIYDVYTVNADGFLIARGIGLDPAVDITALGCAYEDIGLQIDYCAVGNVDMLASCESQIELTSSGGSDQQEISTPGQTILQFSAGEWKRSVMKISLFGRSGTEAFRPENLNFMRIYFVGLRNYIGQSVTLKIGKVRLVNVAKQAPSYEEDPLGFDASEGYLLKELNYGLSGMKTVSSDGYLFGESVRFDPALDFAAMGYNAGTLALQIDTYFSGDAGMPATFSGQIEFTSSGGSDNGEINTDPRRLNIVNGGWARTRLPLSGFGVENYGEQEGKVTFDPSAVNFFRIYLFVGRQYAGQRVMVKLANLRLVDTSKTAPTPDEDPVGDGTFLPAAPTWRAVTVGAGYNDDDIVVAGYSLGDYLAPGTGEDATPYIQSLLDGLDNAGGGTLFIPAGEYVCRGHLSLPPCVSVYGEWQSPEIRPQAGGTVLKIYADKGNPEGNPFIRLNTTCMISNLSFWYPEQSFSAPVAYPATLLGGSHYQVKNVTFFNSYYVLQQGPNMSGCPNVTNIYATPLHQGLDMDGVADIGRLDGIHLAPDYWIGSGLPGAPATAAQQQTLRDFLYQNVTGITLRRIDWSYLCFSEFKGLATGLRFDMSFCTEVFKDGVRIRYDYPNGQNYGLTFEDCRTAVYAVDVSGMGEMVTGSAIRNCENGIVIGNHPEAEGGVLNFSDLDITATDYALLHQGALRVMMLSCRIHGGKAAATNGTLTLTNTSFDTPAPHLELSEGACGAVLVGNTAAGGFAYTNEEQCPVAFDETPAEVGDMPRLSPDGTTGTVLQVRQPYTRNVWVAELDPTGTSDVTAGLQDLLTAAGNAGGGAVFLPDGVYRLNGSVTVPAGVELKGVCDMGRSNPYKGGTILAVYGGKGNADGTPAVTLLTGAGIRGITFDYPEQSHDSSTDFSAYPYAVRGNGSGVYVINVAIRNGWNGVDLKTYRCDGHYVEYLSGTCLGTSIQVGKGARDGYICNFQFNYGAMIHGSETNYGAWENCPAGEDRSAFERKMKIRVQNNAPILVLGDVENEICVNNFNYSGRYGLQFVEENGESANAVIFGHGCDYTVVPVMAEHTENVTFVNLQTTSFNYDGLPFNRDLYEVELGADHTGTVNVYNISSWAPPKAAFHVMNGTLNVYGADVATNGQSVAELESNGRLNLTAAVFTRGESGLTFAGKNPQNFYLNGGFRSGGYTDMGALGRCDNLLRRVSNWSAGALGMPGTFTASGASLNDVSGGQIVVKNGEALWQFNPGGGNWIGLSDAAGVLDGSSSVTYEYEVYFDTDDGNDRAFLSYGDSDKWHGVEEGRRTLSNGVYNGNGYAVHNGWNPVAGKKQWVTLRLVNDRFTASRTDGGCVTKLGSWVNSGTLYLRSILVYDTNDPSKFISLRFNQVSQVLGRSLTLEGKIGVNFYLSVPDGVRSDPDAYVTVNDKRIPLSEIPFGAVAELNDRQLYKVTEYVVAKEMNDRLALTVYGGNGKALPLYSKEGASVGSVGYAAQDYLDTSMARDTGNLLALTRAMSDYGSCAQAYFNYNTDSRAPLQTDVSSLDIGLLDPYAFTGPSGSVSGISYRGSTLVLEEETTIRMYFNLTSSTTIKSFTFTVDGVQQTPKTAQGSYYVEVKNIAARQLDATHVFTVSRNGQTMTVRYSALTYCWVTVHNTSNPETLKDTAKAIYLYNAAANAYFRDPIGA